MMLHLAWPMVEGTMEPQNSMQHRSVVAQWRTIHWWLVHKHMEGIHLCHLQVKEVGTLAGKLDG